MKKISILLLGLMLVFVAAKAQKIGVMAGGTFSTQSIENVETAYTPGFNGAIVFQKTLIPMLSLRPSLGYYQKGTTYNILGVDGLTKLNYVQMNLNLRVKPPLIPVYAVVGPYGSYALSGYSKVGSVSADIDFGKGKTLPYDFGLSAGVGYQMNLLVGKLFIEGGVAKGMLNIDDSGWATTKNMMIYANLGLLLGL